MKSNEFVNAMTVRIINGDCREALQSLPDESVHCVVTSPPYWGLRDYGMAGQIGLELSPDAFVAELVGVFREVRRVLRKDGTVWLNLGDSYSGSGKGGNPDPGSSKQATNKGPQTVGCLYGKTGETARQAAVTNVSRRVTAELGIAPKQLMGIPWRTALALQADGWWLRMDNIWHKPNPTPESVKDRPTRSHEYVFLLSKQDRYYYDAQAIAEPLDRPEEADRKTPAKFGGADKHTEAKKQSRLHSGNEYRGTETGTRNKRSVWTVALSPFSEAHFATFPPALIEPCIKAGSPAGGTVLDPFGGAGTTGLVADRLGRNAILIELNPEYVSIADRRIHADAGMFAEIAKD